MNIIDFSILYKLLFLLWRISLLIWIVFWLIADSRFIGSNNLYNPILGYLVFEEYVNWTLLYLYQMYIVFYHVWRVGLKYAVQHILYFNFYFKNIVL